MPNYVLGVANLRGIVLPVVDLDIRFGRPAQARRRSDCIVVLEREGAAVGIVVNEVQEVRRLPAEGSAATHGAPGFVVALARLEEQVVMRLDVDRLLQLTEGPAGKGSGLWALGSEQGTQPGAQSPEPRAAAEPLPEEQGVFAERARELARPLVRTGYRGQEPVAVVRLGSEFFGFELALVREFTTSRQASPVPCCPDRIAGQMNLRGDIITLVDLRPVLQLPATGTEPLSRVVLLELSDLRFGVLVDEVLEIRSLPVPETETAATALPGGAGEYLKGAVAYRGRMLGILDLPRIVAEGKLVVDEEV
jgi:purine-binding chemotaxis protein CheW